MAALHGRGAPVMRRRVAVAVIDEESIVVDTVLQAAARSLADAQLWVEALGAVGGRLKGYYSRRGQSFRGQ